MHLPLNRRRFLSSAAALLTLPNPLPTHLNAQSAPGSLIDTHVHFYDPTRPAGVPWPSPKDTELYRPILPGEFRELTRSHGVEGVIVVEASKWFADNQWVLDLAKQDPLILGLVGNIAPEQPEFVAQLDHLATHPLFLGLRMNNPTLDADLTRFAQCDKVLDVIACWEILPQILKITEALPSLRIVLEHFNLDFSPVPETAAEQHRLLREVAQAPNIFAKISNVLRKQDGQLVPEPKAYSESLQELWELFGEDRLLFGSNWPVSNRVGPYEVLLHVVSDFFTRKGPLAAVNYFSANSHRIYRWKARTDAQKTLATNQ